MSTLITTNLQHPSSGSPNLVLAADGSVSGIYQGRELIAETAATGSSITFSSLPQTYQRLVFVFRDVVISPATAPNATLRISDSTSANYRIVNSYWNPITNGLTGENSSTPNLSPSGATAEVNIVLVFDKYQSDAYSSHASIFGFGGIEFSGYGGAVAISGSRRLGSALSDLTISTGSSFAGGAISLYGEN